VPRRLENDRWLFGVTLALCLLGAVMIYSASAVTGRPVVRPLVYFSAAAGCVAPARPARNVCLDANRLPPPAGTCRCVPNNFSRPADAGGRIFLDKSHATHRWIRFGPVGIQPSELAKLAVVLYLAWFLDLKRRSASSMEFRKEDLLHTILRPRRRF